MFATGARRSLALVPAIFRHPLDDKRIAFMLFPLVESGLSGGMHMMNLDGSDRRRVADLGAPFWSSDGRKLLINRFSLPTTSTVLNLETGASAGIPGRGESDPLMAELGRAR